MTRQTFDLPAAVEIPEPTLVEEYERAKAEEEEYWEKVRSDRVSTIGRGGSFVLIVAVLLYTAWPWLGILFFVVGSIVVLFCCVFLSGPLDPGSSWEHPLNDVDFSRLAPATVLFSRVCYFGSPKFRGFRVLISKDGKLREILVAAPLREKDTEQFVDRLIRALDTKGDVMPDA